MAQKKIWELTEALGVNLSDKLPAWQGADVGGETVYLTIDQIIDFLNSTPAVNTIIFSNVIISSDTAGLLNASWINNTGTSYDIIDEALVFLGTPETGDFRWDLVELLSDGTVNVNSGVEGVSAVRPTPTSNALVAEEIIWNDAGEATTVPGPTATPWSLLRYNTQLEPDSTGKFAKIWEGSLSRNEHYAIDILYNDPRNASSFAGAGTGRMKVSWTCSTSRDIISDTVKFFTDGDGIAAEFRLIQITGKKAAIYHKSSHYWSRIEFRIVFQSSSVKLNDFVTGSSYVTAPAAIETFNSVVTEGANNYTHPNHSGDVTSIGDGATVIANGVVTRPKLSTNVNTSLDAADLTICTGIIFGGVLSINAGDTSKIDISAGAGYVVNHTVTPAIVTYVTWDDILAVTLTNLATATSTDMAINISGGVVQQSSYTNQELRTVIFLGGVDHAGGTINNTFSVQVPSFAPGLSVRDLARAIGDLNLSGNTFSAAATNLTIAKNVGQSFSFGRNTATDKNNPHIISQPFLSPVTFNYIYRNGIGGTSVSASGTNINPLNFDNGTGALATVGVNDFAFQQFLLFPNSNNVFIQYGTTTYNTLNEAINGLSTTTFPVLPGFTSAMRRGVLIVKRGTTDLSDTTDARFFAADKFGSIAGAIGTGAEAGGDMLAAVYDPAAGARQVAFQDELYPEAVLRANNTVLFDKDYITGNAGARTGNILFDFTGAKLGATTYMKHQDASAFTFPAQAVLLFDAADVSITVANFFCFMLVDKTASSEKVHVTLSQVGV
jgi:hypothetical protein